MIDKSDIEGEESRRNEAPGEGITCERVVDERRGLESEGAEYALRRMEGRGEAELDDGFELRLVVIGSKIFGRGRRF